MATQTLAKKIEKCPREDLLRMSSDDIATLLLKLLQENDNSENPMDDSHYLGQVLKSLGKLDNFKYLPAIAQEVFRQFKLDNIGRRCSPQFSITKGAISAYFGIRKQLFIYNHIKREYIDEIIMREDLLFNERQAGQAESQTLSLMETELQTMFNSPAWPLEVRFHIAALRVKHCFLYQGNPFLVSIYRLLMP